jgi:carbamoyltransferase
VVNDQRKGRSFVYSRAASNGGRALGNHSILADSRRPEMKDIVSTKIKFREPFCPFASVALEDGT